MFGDKAVAVIANLCHAEYCENKGEAAMRSMNISLPDQLKEYVDAEIAKGRYSSVSEYVRELIRADEKRRAEDQLESLLVEGLSSEETALTPVDWKDIRTEALATVKARKTSR